MTNLLSSFPAKMVLKLFPLLLLLSFEQACAEEYKISMEGWEYHPKELTIELGDTVIWVNDDDTLHNLVFEDETLGAPVIKKPLKIRQGQEFSFTFTKAGVFKYFCKIHKRQDMVGKIIVKATSR